ncbi:hypothetical protein DOT_5065 [Desulfosporosinus sp. OT]|nr:hypothetical protein DOT_5065 [Desulfosporosinus sp. OT]
MEIGCCLSIQNGYCSTIIREMLTTARPFQDDLAILVFEYN